MNVSPEILFLAIVSLIFVTIAAYLMPQRLVLGLLILSPPFQLISSHWMTSTVATIYLVFIIAVVRGWIMYLPAPKILLLLISAYLLALMQVEQTAFIDHLMYIVSFLANILVLILVYNRARCGELWQ